ncbi:cobalamin B12-binding domain-containing protein [Gracilibacillus halophilus YIM-C55.5]|uniref:Cobalamin B12-binding domain-containing protein n=1 Tax=Gracilibacillus halophilus YIM-C55.5 TaxID=1308866 RepID=N4WTC7_9BACI|nr:cobalamin B12-binding domain-containing protein [Gracilibacillus halophilus]ENH97575.1 cobalamin B12-binding domain-containing protein [Gracilibacillus halophilus YIM-C55.5]
MHTIEEIQQEYIKHILTGQLHETDMFINHVLEEDFPVIDVYVAITCAMYEIGEMWNRNQISVADEHIATAISQFILTKMASTSLKHVSDHHKQVAIFSIETNQHYLGIQIVQNIFREFGYQTTFFGPDVPNQDILPALVNMQPHYIAFSITLASQVSYAQHLIHAIRNEPTLINSKIMIGGYVFHQDPLFIQMMDVDYFFWNAYDLYEWLDVKTNGQGELSCQKI